ncbi:MAG: hypothetical protein EOO09_11140 [Chitinophagaceae bacterium]|nr:MAG: hypothetical protein EOO09_11140 [Chitinophagaceae bacterium]
MKTAVIKIVLYVLAAMFVAGWLVSVLFFVTGMFIHILLMAGVFLLMQGVILCPKPQRNVAK